MILFWERLTKFITFSILFIRESIRGEYRLWQSYRARNVERKSRQPQKSARIAENP